MQDNNLIFFTGVPGSRWSGVSQVFRETWDNVDNSDLVPEKTYNHPLYNGHIGNYYGPGMLYGTWLDKKFGSKEDWQKEILKSYTSDDNIKLILSHHFAYYLDNIKETFPKSPIVICYRKNIDSFEWWHHAGGWDITYPSYKWYHNDTRMQLEIKRQNNCILEFISKNNLVLEQPNKDFFRTHFKKDIDFVFDRDVEVAVYV